MGLRSLLGLTPPYQPVITPVEMPMLPNVYSHRDYVAAKIKETPMVRPSALLSAMGVSIPDGEKPKMTVVDDVKKSVDEVAAKVAVVKEKADALAEAHKQFRAAVTDMVSVASPPAV